MLIERAKSRGILLDQAEDIKPDTYRKRIERELSAIQSLCEPMIPLEKYDGNPVNYALPIDYSIPVSDIDITLAMALHFTKQVFSNVLPETQMNQLQDYYASAESRFKNEREAKPYKNFIDSIAWHPEGYGNKLIQNSQQIILPSNLTKLAEALYRKHKIEFEYHLRYANTMSSMKVSPLALVLRGHIIYLVAGYFHKGKYNFRHLHCGRIGNIKFLDGENSEFPDDFSLQRYILDGAFEKDHFVESTEQVIELKIDDHLKQLFQERMRKSSFKETGDGLVVSFTEKPYPEFIWWLLSFGSQLEVLKPLSLREKLKTEVAKMHDNYEQ